MFNKKLVIAFLAFIFIQAINAVIMKKEDILKIDPKKMDGDKCPEASVGLTEGFCGYYFICKNDTCNSINQNNMDFTRVEFPNEKGELTNYIINGSCQTNEQCLSNNCSKNQCINRDSGVSECIVNRSSSKLHCGKIAYEICQTDDECSSNKCSDSHLCLSEYHDEIMKIGTTALIIIIIGIVLIIGCCCAICCCCCKKSNKN